MPIFEVLLVTGKRRTWAVWEGKDGPDACQSYADSHPGNYQVIAWRDYPRHGLFIGVREIIEPGHWRYGKD